MKAADSFRSELTMKGAAELYSSAGADVSEVYSQSRIAQQAAMQKLQLGWSLDLTMDDPVTGKAWNMGDPATRSRVRSLVRDTKPFMLIGSSPCTMFSSLQNMRRGARNTPQLARDLEIAKKHVRFCMQLYKMQADGGSYFCTSTCAEQPRGRCRKSQGLPAYQGLRWSRVTCAPADSNPLTSTEPHW